MGNRQVRTLCPINCHPTYCGMRVEVSDAGRLVGITGDRENPDSQGFLCIRGRATPEIFNNPRRLRTPLVRAGRRGENRWQPVSWDEALDRIAQKMGGTTRERVGLWLGHGALVTGINRPLIMRFGHLGGFQVWNPAIVCWALGAYGLAITGILETNTKEDMAANSNLIILWGANLASQPTTAPHLIAARKRGARVIVIDVRRAEAARHADEVYLIRPGTDAAMALAMAHVLVAEGLTDPRFIAEHTVGFDRYARHLGEFTPEWAAAHTGLLPDQIRHLARLYGHRIPAMILVGGSSMYKHRHGWQASRAIATLPALTGQLGIAGGGLGPRHRGFPHGDTYADLAAADQRPPGRYVPSHMPSIAQCIADNGLDVLILLGTNLLSSFSDAGAIERDLDKVGLVVAYDLFANETVRRAADVVLPGTAWLEEIGLKDTATHLYFMEKALEPEGETRPLIWILRRLAERLKIADFFPWADEEAYVNTYLAPQHNGTLTVAGLRARGGFIERSRLSHIAYPEHHYHTPSSKVEFYSERAAALGLPPLPVFTPHEDAAEAAQFGLEFRQGRTLTAFHAFYDSGQALPTLAKADPHPEVWIHPIDAETRRVRAGQLVELFNQRGTFRALARVTEDVRPGVVWMRDGWAGLNHLTSGEAALSVLASEGLDFRIPGGQAAYQARVEVRAVEA